jgi:hypothetical protein
MVLHRQGDRQVVDDLREQILRPRRRHRRRRRAGVGLPTGGLAAGLLGIVHAP